jgi:hypothetical protein
MTIDFLAELRNQHGPITEDELHQGYDALLDAWLATHFTQWEMEMKN